MICYIDCSIRISRSFANFHERNFRMILAYEIYNKKKQITVVNQSEKLKFNNLFNVSSNTSVNRNLNIRPK